MVEKLKSYREIVIKVAGKVDAGIVDIKRNKPWEREKIQQVNFDRYHGKNTRGGLGKLRTELQAENKWVVLALVINWIGEWKDMQRNKVEAPGKMTLRDT